MSGMRRREFVALLSGAAAAWPIMARAQTYPSRPIAIVVPAPPGGPYSEAREALCDETARFHHAHRRRGGHVAARGAAQQPAMPVVAFVTPSERDSLPPRYVAAFRKDLSDTGYIEGQNVSVEYHWLEGRYDPLAGTNGRPQLAGSSFWRVI
jgi:hypothetical protein